MLSVMSNKAGSIVNLFCYTRPIGFVLLVADVSLSNHKLGAVPLIVVLCQSLGTKWRWLALNGKRKQYIYRLSVMYLQ